MARVSAVSLVSLSKEMGESLGIRLLADLRHIFGAQPIMASRLILESLFLLEESHWGELKGKPLTERGLAKLLKEYGVRSKTIRIGDGTTTARGYARADLTDAWARYLSIPATSDTSHTSDTSATPDAPPLQPGLVSDRGNSARRRLRRAGGHKRPFLHPIAKLDGT